jgi:hypothetical protein
VAWWWRGSLLLLLLLPVASIAQQVEHQGLFYPDVSSALAVAAAGDTLIVDGDVSDTVTVDKDITILGLAGAVLRSSDAAILTLAQGVDLTIDGVDLVGTGATRAIDTASTGNQLVVRNGTIDARFGAGTGVNGGAVRLIEPVSAVFDSVTFVGIPGQPQSQLGGAIYAYAVSNTPMTLTDVVFDHIESTGSGGAIWASSMAISCVRCTFDHSDGAFGGSLYAASGSLYIEQSMFCGSYGGLGGAVFSSGDTDIRSTVFQENTAYSNGGALFANGGVWTVINNHFVGNGGAEVLYANTIPISVTVTNNLFLSNTSEALDLSAGASPTTSYNWFHGNPTNSAGPLSATDITTGGDPLIVRWSLDGNCDNDELWPTPIVSPLIDAGDPGLDDPDGGRSDIGAFGGPEADPDLHTDHDGDGPPFLHDCDDDDAANFPGNDESCDLQDNDCDGVIDEEPIDIDEFFEDCDLDGQGVPGTGVIQCFAPAPPSCGGGWASSNDLGTLADADCDDTDASTYVGAYEYCDIVDHDCDGDASEGAIDATTYYVDLDGDGYGTTDFLECADAPPPGSALVGGDCQDQDETVFPGAVDPCGDGIDQDCNGEDGNDESVRVWFQDLDGDGYGDPTVPPVLDCRDGAGAQMVQDATDCDDTRPSVHPGATESCNGLDDDCDNRVDNVGEPQKWFLDSDGDGFGDVDTALEAECAPGPDWIDQAGDCDDDDPDRASDCSVGELIEIVDDKIPEGCACASPSGGPPGGGLMFLACLVALRRGRVGGAPERQSSNTATYAV